MSKSASHTVNLTRASLQLSSSCQIHRVAARRLCCSIPLNNFRHFLSPNRLRTNKLNKFKVLTNSCSNEFFVYLLGFVQAKYYDTMRNILFKNIPINISTDVSSLLGSVKCVSNISVALSHSNF